MRHAVRRRQHPDATTANGRSRGIVCEPPHLDIPPAAGTEIPRRRAGPSERRSREHQPLGSAQPEGADEAIENELVAINDRTFRWALRKPYPKMLLALGKTSTPCCFVMPARIAATDPFKQISEYVGSGPMRFVRNEWVPGAKAAFEKFADSYRDGVMVRGRQEHCRRPHRVDNNPRSGHGLRRFAERRGRLAGNRDTRPVAGPAQKSQCGDGDKPSSGDGRHAAHEPRSGYHPIFL
jgi:hypothetical protein